MRQLGYKNVSALCKNNPGLHQTCIGNLINLKTKPIKKGGKWTDQALKLMDILCCSPDDLWSDAQRNYALKNNKKSVELAESQIKKLISPTDPEALSIESQKNKTINVALQDLTPREEKVLKMRFGLKPYFREYTLQETGKSLGVGQERVRQIERKGLRKLRHPLRSRGLKDIIQND